SAEKRPSVQVSDPFTEKLLIEACLEMIDKDLISGLQDLGGAGLTCATCETAERGGCGMDVEIKKVPLREADMEPVEIMMSESQERMFALCPEENLKAVLGVCEKWDLDAVPVANVTEGDTLRLMENGTVIAEVPASSLADGPVYQREASRPEYLDEVNSVDTGSLSDIQDLKDTMLKLLASPNICSRRWVYEQYDHMVGVSTVILPGSDAAVLRVEGTKKGLALACDCNGRYCYLDPRMGTKIALAECARNIACSGASPVAVTNCLNFGNPEKPGIFWQFQECIEGLSEGCKQLGTPVVGGNVSFYNESFGEAILPTPVVGLLGVIEDVANRVESAFRNEGDLIIMLGETRDELGGSELLKVLNGNIAGKPPEVRWVEEKALIDCLVRAASEGIMQSAHDLSEGGLAVALAECCILGRIGARVKLETDLPFYVECFGESQARALISVKSENEARLKEIAGAAGINVEVLGECGGDEITVEGAFSVNVDEIADIYENSLAKMV
ncbi:MAG: phosphoribosylformylglycinamidine synthase subunit PurL, partial [Actinobacteria bacterium]|nr:phosphoribosylformylglycinamidine synthase subunit PurL [Actinomycetota bacterium]